MSRELTDRDRIESEIGDDREDREIVIYLRVETVSCDIEIVREELDHGDRYDRCEDLPTDLSKSVGIYFPSGHERSIGRNMGKAKLRKRSLEKNSENI